MFVVPSSVPAGPVSLRVHNTGGLPHAVMVLPLTSAQYPGQRAIGANGEVDESGSLAEASRTCGADKGDGVLPGATAWTTLTLAPGRYELLCNIAGHYGAGMYTELDVIGNRQAQTGLTATELRDVASQRLAMPGTGSQAGQDHHTRIIRSAAVPHDGGLLPTQRD